MAVCYRHPGRETGVSCSNCGNPICPDCMTPTSVGMRCPECAKQKTKVRGMPGLGDDPVVTYGLIGVNLAIALFVFLSGASVGGGGDVSKLTTDLWVARVYIADGDYWRLITNGFVHDGLLHVGLNMYLLYVLGNMLEPSIGRLRFGLIYLVALLGGSFGALLVEPNGPTLGASGAVFGLMGAGVLFMRGRGINPMESGLGFLIGLNLLITFLYPGQISVGGHVGGLVAGGLCGYLMFELGDRVRLPRYVPIALCAAVGVLAVIGSVAISG